MIKNQSELSEEYQVKQGTISKIIAKKNRYYRKLKLCQISKNENSTVPRSREGTSMLYKILKI